MGMVKCKDCGEQISSDADKCPKCGKYRTRAATVIAGILGGLILAVFLLFFLRC